MAKPPTPRPTHRLPACKQWAMRWAGLAGIVAATGCSLVYSPAPDLTRRDEVMDLSRVAVLVGSVTQSDPQLPVRNPHSEVTFSFENVAGGGRFFLHNARLGWTGAAADKGLEAEHGRLFAVPLEPGTYALTRVSMWVQAQVDVVLPDPPRVTVGAGDVVYIGNLEIENCYSVYVRPDGERVRQTVVGGFPSVTDRSERDLNLLRTTYPVLREAVIDVRLPEGADISRQARDELSRACSYEVED